MKIHKKAFTGKLAAVLAQIILTIGLIWVVRIEQRKYDYSPTRFKGQFRDFGNSLGLVGLTLLCAVAFLVALGAPHFYENPPPGLVLASQLIMLASGVLAALYLKKLWSHLQWSAIGWIALAIFAFAAYLLLMNLLALKPSKLSRFLSRKLQSYRHGYTLRKNARRVRKNARRREEEDEAARAAATVESMSNNPSN